MKRHPIPSSVLSFGFITGFALLIAMTAAQADLAEAYKPTEPEALSERINRRPGILHEPSEHPVGDQASLYEIKENPAPGE